MNWFKENIKWLLSIVTFIGGLLLGFYLAVVNFNSKLDSIETTVNHNFELIKGLSTKPVPSDTYFKQLIEEVINE